ncbi:MAG: glutaredoxin family protein [Aquabacterium sp.]|jgi:glutaredoxin|nr:MAG: glutaredoxin family protein [Aquabacterium sp.]TAL16761.1 MAG: glutaredoxin family protein [Aquabacterium sp.]
MFPPAFPRLLLQSLLAAGALAVLPANAGSGSVDPSAYDTVRAQLGSNELTVYTAPGCRYCAQARRWLRERELPFAECDVQRSPACAEQFAAHGGRGVPYFVLQGREMAGFSPGALESLVQTLR